jgi:hypothetical protein
MPELTDEEFVISTAKLQIQGLIWGSPYIELAESTAIVADTGYISTVSLFGRVKVRHLLIWFSSYVDRVQGQRMGFRQVSLLQSHIGQEQQDPEDL